MTKILTIIIALLVFSSCKKELILSNIVTSTVTDHDGNEYPTIIIGTQEWMAGNLKTTKFSNGVPIPNVQDDAAWSNTTVPATCFYDNDSITNEADYGRLYNWQAISNENNICPSSWHVPTKDEWMELIDNLGGENKAAIKLKTVNTLTWAAPNEEISTNEAMFNAEPSGLRKENGKFFNLKYFAYFWSSSENTNNKISIFSVSYSSNGVGNFDGNQKEGYAIRCLKD